MKGYNYSRHKALVQRFRLTGAQRYSLTKSLVIIGKVIGSSLKYVGFHLQFDRDSDSLCLVTNFHHVLHLVSSGQSSEGRPHRAVLLVRVQGLVSLYNS